MQIQHLFTIVQVLPVSVCANIICGCNEVQSIHNVWMLDLQGTMIYGASWRLPIAFSRGRRASDTIGSMALSNTALDNKADSSLQI